MADWPQSLKPIGKFMARAREVESTSPLVAYYCNFHSLRRAMLLRDKTDESANRFVVGLLEKCETAKERIGPDDGTHRGLVEEFALSVFDRADAEDRAGHASKATAITFYAAMCFLEVCTVFAPLTSDLAERLRYAKWKAADITKALREGRTPVPGAPGEAEARAKAEAEAAARIQAELDLESERGDAVTSDAVLDPSFSSSPSHVHASAPPAPPAPDFDVDADSRAAEYTAHSSSMDLYPAAPKYPSSEAPSPIPSARAPPPVSPPPPLPPAMPAVPTLVIDAPLADRSRRSVFGRAQHRGGSEQAFDAILPNGERDVSLPLPQGVADKTPQERKSPLVMYPSVDSEVQTPVNVPAPLPHTPVVPPLVGLAREPEPTTLPPNGARREAVYDADYRPTAKQTQEAQKLAKYATSALDFQDVRTAIGNLEQALALLRGVPK